MIDNFYITQDISTLQFFYYNNEKIFIIEVEYDNSYNFLEVDLQEYNKLLSIIEQNKNNIVKLKLYKK